jgi:hypothetical protein
MTCYICTVLLQTDDACFCVYFIHVDVAYNPESVPL